MSKKSEYLFCPFTRSEKDNHFECSGMCGIWYKGMCSLVMIAAALYSRELALPTDKPLDRNEAPGASMQIIDPTSDDADGSAQGKGEI